MSAADPERTDAFSVHWLNLLTPSAASAAPHGQPEVHKRLPYLLELDHVERGQGDLRPDPAGAVGQEPRRRLIEIEVLRRHAVRRHDHIEAAERGRAAGVENCAVGRDTDRNHGGDTLVL